MMTLTMPKTSSPCLFLPLGISLAGGTALLVRGTTLMTVEPWLALSCIVVAAIVGIALQILVRQTEGREVHQSLNFTIHK